MQDFLVIFSFGADSTPERRFCPEGLNFMRRFHNCTKTVFLYGIPAFNIF